MGRKKNYKSIYFASHSKWIDQGIQPKPKKKKKVIFYIHYIIFQRRVDKLLSGKSKMAKKVEEIHFLALKIWKSLILSAFGEFAKIAVKWEHLGCHHEN